jgi:membrane carboxypeptidase/penicillin-binding protein
MALGGLVLAAGLAAYYAQVVYAARQYTREVVLPQAKARIASGEPLALTPRRLDILLQVEDPRFFEHGGVDLTTPGAGITTITQGLVKQLYFEKFEPGLAKIKQTLVAACALDPLMPKELQLDLFFHTVYLGPRAKGFAQAAETYFHKPFAQLTEEDRKSVV